ncbi:hypothetical protein QQS21_009122 [Conoideocrella luteorostrata]|uniref:Triacylglycerol lipase n=1 Tax=Conoideocrella luteorostrata TaxID=1105319 RepID=A0AAJ0CJX3_9HYPO|nr:hypothetical protein QQS21_009122 [Conoideocrella luteorostrata]
MTHELFCDIRIGRPQLPHWRAQKQVHPDACIVMVLLSSFVTLALASLSANTHPAPAKRAAQTLPSNDPFYAAPQNLTDYSPGAIIRSRKPPGPLGFFSARINLQGAWQLLYRSTGAHGEPLASVTTVLIPYNADFGKLLSYQVEIDAPYEACFPSISLQQSEAHFDTVTGQYGELWIMTALARGWAVSVPDHEGPQAAFTAGLVEGRVTLDNVRAVLQSGHITGVLPEAQAALWGYSGGAQATEWALELQKEYAPELHIIAAALGGVPANLEKAFEQINKGTSAGLAAGGILGLAKAYPALAALLKDRLESETASRFYQAQEQCLVPTLIQFVSKDVFSFFDGGSSFLQDPVFQDILRENAMGNHGVYKVPTYFYHAINDDILPFNVTEALVDRYCGAGANIHFSREAFGKHITVALTGAAGALKFLMDRMEGRPLRPGCSKSTVVSSALVPENLPILGETVFNAVNALLGKPLGPAASI